MISAPRTIDLSDDLFELKDDAEEAEESDAGAGEVAAAAFPAEEAPSAGFLALVGTTRERLDRRKKKPKTMAAAVFNRALAEVDEMLRSGEWEGAGARHMVALYDRMHERCYGIEPAELGPTERFQAGLLAGNMLKSEFRGDVVEMVEFVLWAWERELGRERWRRENGKDGGRLGARLMFRSGSGAFLLTDYRVHLARRGARP